jgi:hypothetical protein
MMFIWELRGIGILTALLTALLILRLITGRLILPAWAYLVCSIAGFSAYLAFLLFSETATTGGGSITAATWEVWLLAAPIILPLVAGLVGWVAARSSWRRYFLAAGIGLLLFPWVAALAVYLLGGAGRR